MDEIALEEALARYTVAYYPHPGDETVEYLRQFYEVTEEDEGRTIKIKYKA